MLVPKLVTTLRTYTRDQLFADLGAGVVVGIVALPLAIAFAIASGVTPERGLYTAIVAGLVISALGGSRVQIGGPTGAFVVIVYGIVQTHGIDGLMLATMMAGVILIVLGVARLGGAIKFIPFPIITGFTSGIALIIAASQVRDFLGLRMDSVPAEFVSKWLAYAGAIESVNPWALVIGALTLAILLWYPLLDRRLPAPFVALVVTTVAVAALGLPVETIGARFGEIDASLPRPSLPSFAPAMVPALIGPAFAIALLAAIESLLSAVVADGMIGSRHRSNMELVAQGAANIASPLFGGIPATGAIARTATNVKSGGRTPVAGIVHALTLLVITVAFGRWAALIPMATLAGILLLVAYRMSEWRVFRGELRAPRSDVVVLLTTFVLTVLVDLVVAIEVGMVLAAFLFMRRMAEVTNVRFATREFGDVEEDMTDPNAVRRRAVPAGVEVYEIDGPFFFGAAEKFRETLWNVARKPKVLIIRMRNVPAIDSTGLRAFTELVHRSRRDGTRVILSDVHAQPMMAMARSELLDEIGEENLLGNIDDALNVARRHLGLPEEPRPVFATPTVARETPEGGVPRVRDERDVLDE
ncbi:MAG TPA: SulP family inorganic anion transporter [Gemmatimonadaceae bacterium]|nr:SulP family inorganic anion transporter [Gemmatimonadaceae bacterium]